jgi:hypothetical protein
MELVGSSVNLYNCRFEGGWAPGEENNSIKVDNASSLVAYEHRYLGPPHDKIFVNSISYDATNEIGYKNWSNPSTPASPAPWLPTSVWGPLRAVIVSLKADIVVTNQFEMSSETWDDFGTSTPLLTSNWGYPHVLGLGSNELSMPGGKDVWSSNVVGTISSPAYYVWSIHTYLEEVEEDNMSQVWGEIIYEWLPTPLRLGLVYFKYRHWACSYGMKWFDPGGKSFKFKLAFHNASGSDARFCITDYQIVKFDTLAAANSFVNSREFAKWVGEGGDQG